MNVELLDIEVSGGVTYSVISVEGMVIYDKLRMIMKHFKISSGISTPHSGGFEITYLTRGSMSYCGKCVNGVLDDIPKGIDEELVENEVMFTEYIDKINVLSQPTNCDIVVIIFSDVNYLTVDVDTIFPVLLQEERFIRDINTLIKYSK